MRVNPKGLALVILAAQAINHFFGMVRFAQTDRGSGSDGPFEMGVADFLLDLPARLPSDSFSGLINRA